MWVHRIVVPTALFDDHGCFAAHPKPLQTEALVATLSVESLVGALLSRLAGVDDRRLDSLVGETVRNGPRDKLRTLVRSQVMSAMNGKTAASRQLPPHRYKSEKVSRRVTCGTCGRQARVDPAEVLTHPRMRVADLALRLRCRDCRHRIARIDPVARLFKQPFVARMI